MQQLPLTELDASAVRAWARSALVELAAARAEIDALNVYPVPDGDTGTNLYLTFDAAVEAIAGVPESAAAAQVLHAMAQGAFLAARGNSGVILSQALRGLAEAAGEGGVDAATVAKALAQAADAAYAAVAQPVEGTMLTVLRSAAVAATSAPDLAALVAAAAVAAREALARTPEQLDVLRQAGVVDAGGRGICVLLDVLEHVVTGVSPGLQESDRGWPNPFLSAPQTPVASPSYEVMFLLEAEPEALPALRAQLNALGDSVVLGGADATWNVHAHVDDVGSALEAALVAGRPREIRVTALQAIVHPHVGAEHERAVVVVLGSEGFNGLFEKAGATITIVSSEPASTEAVTAAFSAAGVAELVVVPTDEAGYEVARAAAEAMRGPKLRIEVVPARVPVQALCALAAHDPLCRFEDDLLQMTAAAARCRHGAVAAADEGNTLSGPGPGHIVGSIDAEVVVTGASPAHVACDVVDRLLAAGGVALTVVSGMETGGAAAAVLEHVRQRHPDIDVVCHEAAHPSVLLLGVE